MENNKYVLNELNQGLKMGMDSISSISDKIGDKKFKNELIFQYNQYHEILDRVNIELDKYTDTPKKLNPIKKAMSWMDIEISTIKNKSNSNLANMMIRGTTMGVINGIKLSNENPDINMDVKNILNEFIVHQQNSIEQLKTYL